MIVDMSSRFVYMCENLDKKLKNSTLYMPVGPKNPFCLFYLTELCWDCKLVFSENTLAG